MSDTLRAQAEALARAEFGRPAKRTRSERHAAYLARLQARLERQPVDAEYARLRDFAAFAGSVPGAWLDPLLNDGWDAKVRRETGQS